MQAHLAQVAPSLDPVRAAELAGELESLRRETADIERDDRRRAADERVQVAQQRVDKLAGDFATATTNADALTAKVKELGTALQQLEPGPGFAAKLSQALADTLEFLSARSP
jgi:polyhydroxyalkanoate synthesis regulator phasin